MPGGFSYLGDFKVTDSGGEISSASVGDKALLSTAVDGSTIELNSSNKIGLKDAGVTRSKAAATAGKWATGSLTASDSAAGMFQLTNSTGSNMLVTRVLIYLTTKTSGDCTVDIGVGSSASTVYNNLIDGLDIHTAVGVFDNITDKGSSGTSRQIWTNGQYVNGSVASGNSAGVVGFYAVHYVDVVNAG